VTAEWVLFLVSSVGTFVLLWPIGRSLERRTAFHTAGPRRWVGREALVLADIPGGPGRTGMVRLDREEWRAESGTGTPIPAGSTVLVSRVDGTRLVGLCRHPRGQAHQRPAGREVPRVAPGHGQRQAGRPHRHLT